MAHPQTSFKHTTFSPGSFCATKRDVVWENTLIYQLDVLRNTGRYDAFRLKRHPSYDDEIDHWPVPKHLFWDSDVAKWIEGACYFLQERSNDEIESAIRELVDMIAAAQQPDGYLNIHYTVVEPGKRFTNLRDMHELYNAGHLIEAAVAHHHLHGTSLLLDTLVKYVALLCDTFGPGCDQKHGYPGHPEIELSLLRLYEITKDPKHLKLAQYFIDERGNPDGPGGKHYYDVESAARGESLWQRPNSWPMARSYWYQQAHKPILEQDTIEGHSVRAMYLLTAVADLDRYCNRQEYRDALVRLWDNMVEKKMYLTGGAGAMDQWEGFGIDYFLPQSTDEGGCYAETCASVGVMMLAERMLQIDLNGKYGDIMELAFFNTVLSGMSRDGKQFTYVNQLASSDQELSMRENWFTCACCPPNVARTLGYLGGYFSTFRTNETCAAAIIQVHMFGSTNLNFSVGEHPVELIQRSNWPWEGDMSFEVKGTERTAIALSVRIPGWAPDWQISPELPNAEVKSGYLSIPPGWLRRNSTFTLKIAIVPRLLSPHPLTNQDVVAVARGPLIYCVEDVDNSWVNDHFKSLVFDTSAPISTTIKLDEQTDETYVMLTASGPFGFLDLKNGPKAYPGLEPEAADTQTGQSVDSLHFVPYYFRANRRGKGHMRVGLKRARSWMQIAATTAS